MTISGASEIKIAGLSGSAPFGAWDTTLHMPKPNRHSPVKQLLSEAYEDSGLQSAQHDSDDEAMPAKQLAAAKTLQRMRRKTAQLRAARRKNGPKLLSSTSSSEMLGRDDSIELAPAEEDEVMAAKPAAAASQPMKKVAGPPRLFGSPHLSSRRLLERHPQGT